MSKLVFLFMRDRKTNLTFLEKSRQLEKNKKAAVQSN